MLSKQDRKTALQTAVKHLGRLLSTPQPCPHCKELIDFKNLLVETSSPINGAEQWLLNYLSSGWAIPVIEVVEAGAKEGYTRENLVRTRKRTPELYAVVIHGVPCWKLSAKAVLEQGGE